ncbi:hypothetical protein D3C76_1315530 [compost metagenome]
MGKLRALRFVDGHGIDRLVGWQPAGQQGAQGAVRLLKPYLESPAFIGQAEPHIAVVEADPVVVAHHHHRATGIPVAIAGDEASP